jgi:hypothetical protein
MSESEVGGVANPFVDALVEELLKDDEVIEEGEIPEEQFTPIALTKPPNPLPACVAALPLKPPTILIDGLPYWICQYTGQPILNRVGVPDAKPNGGNGYTMRGAFADWNCVRTWICQRKWDNALTDEQFQHYLANINAAAGAPVGNTKRKSSLVTWGGNVTPSQFRNDYKVYLSGNQSLGAMAAASNTPSSNSQQSTPRAAGPPAPPKLSFFNVEGGRIPESAGNKANFGKALVGCFEPKATHLGFRGVYLPQVDAIYFKPQACTTVPKSVADFLTERTGKTVAPRAADAKMATPIQGSVSEGLLVSKASLANNKRPRKAGSAHASGTSTPKSKPKAKKAKVEAVLAAASDELTKVVKKKKSKSEDKGKAPKKAPKSGKSRKNIANAAEVFHPPPPSAIVSVGAN